MIEEINIVAQRVFKIYLSGLESACLILLDY